MPINFDCEAFVSAPIRLAAKIIERRINQHTGQVLSTSEHQTPISTGQTHTSQQASLSSSLPNTKKTPMTIRHARQLPTSQTERKPAAAAAAALRMRAVKLSAPSMAIIVVALISSFMQISFADLMSSSSTSQHRNSQLISNTNSEQQQHEPVQAMRHHAHYLNFVPSAHFSYQEGRQFGARSLLGDSMELSPPVETVSNSHIYKRSSAILAPPPPSPSDGVNPLSRRMMSSSGSSQEQQLQQTQDNRRSQVNWLGVGASSEPELMTYRQMESNNEATTVSTSLQHNNKKQTEHEAELLRQKQHIQYHDQWPSMAGKCHKRTLNFCASVLPFNTTTFPNIIGDTNRFEVKRSLPFFGFLAKSSCNKRLDELLCLLLEPPCSIHSGAAIPPCKKFCRLALEGCNEYIPATLALSSVFDCRQYPDSNDPNVCINLAQGSKCAQDEFKCPDKTCIPSEYLFKS